MQIKCPKCKWEPHKNSRWSCESCGYEMDMFNNMAICPQCQYEHANVYCIEWEGGCGELSPHLDWYEGLDEKLLDINVKKILDE